MSVCVCVCERGYTLDMAGYEQAMTQQRERARAAGAFKVDYSDQLQLDGETSFTGYETLSGQGQITALIKDGESVSELIAGEQGVVVLDNTPFYAESGGQAGDSGYLRNEAVEFEVHDCQKQGANFLHIGVLTKGSLSAGQRLDAEVNPEVRRATALNHSATHLLHAALREILGEHVSQKGSLVDSKRLRFDFSHFEAIAPNQLRQIERRVNDEIRRNTAVETEICDMDTAVANGAMALFGEKYGDKVRVLTMGEGFSVELCGGTHVTRTGDIGLLRITSEAGIAAGVRRIEAVTGERALAYIDDMECQLDQISKSLKTGRDKAVAKLKSLLVDLKAAEKQAFQLKAKLATAAGADLASQARNIAGVNVLAAALEGADPKSLRTTVDQLKNKLGSGAVILAASRDDKISLVAGVTADITDKLKASELLQNVAQQVGGKGGGRPDMAQGGGSDLSALPAALDSVYGWAEEKLTKS